MASQTRRAMNLGLAECKDFSMHSPDILHDYRSPFVLEGRLPYGFYSNHSQRPSLQIYAISQYISSAAAKNANANID